jgi:hypothetical protein
LKPRSQIAAQTLTGDEIMLTKSTIALTFALGAASIASAPLAKDSGVPTIDIDRSCQASATALGSIYNGDTKDAVNVCMMDEQGARDELAKNWDSYPALAKARCVQTREYLPGYVEWLACIEMTRDVIQLRKQELASSAAPESANASSRPGKRRAGSGECPAVQMKDDGSIAYITNCR